MAELKENKKKTKHVCSQATLTKWLILRVNRASAFSSSSSPLREICLFCAIKEKNRAHKQKRDLVYLVFGPLHKSAKIKKRENSGCNLSHVGGMMARTMNQMKRFFFSFFLTALKESLTVIRHHGLFTALHDAKRRQFSRFCALLSSSF